MLTGEYNVLIDNMWLTDILSVILLILPIFLLFYEKKWIFGLYVVSIVANLPLIFVMSFKFSYEIIIIIVIILSIFKDLIINKSLRYVTTKESMGLIFALLLILLVNVLTSLFNLNQDELINRLILYSVNIFILFVFTYFLINRQRIETLKIGVIVGALILIISMIVEMLYGYYILRVNNLRPAGLLLDPNVAAFALNLSLIITFFKTKKDKFLGNIILVSTRVLIVFAIFLTVSRSAYISTIVILSMLVVYYSIGKKRWICASTVIVITLMYFIFYNVVNDFIRTIYGIIDLQRIFPSAAFAPPGGSPSTPGSIIVEPDYSNSRITLIKGAFDVFINNLIFGVGIGNVVPEIYEITNINMNAHNLFLQLMAESGIFIFATIVIFAYFLVRLIVETSSKTRFFTIMIVVVVVIETMFNHNILNINIIWVVVSFLIAISVIYSKEQRVYSLNKDTFRRKKRKIN